MRNLTRALLLGSAAILLMAAPLFAAVEVITPANTTHTVTFTATVSEQCDIVALPAAIGFTVTDHTAATVSADQTVTLENIVLNEGKKLKISLQANAAAFTKPVDSTGDGNYAAGDVSWNNGGGWTNGTGAANTLSNASYTEVVTSNANVATLSTTGLVFTLAAVDAIDRAGDFTLVATWKIEGNI